MYKEVPEEWVMEKLDYLRWYIGDTRIRNSKGYLINVNPYSENIYKSTIIYKIVNVFLYSDFLWIRWEGCLYGGLCSAYEWIEN